jgi:hypothetical protein
MMDIICQGIHAIIHEGTAVINFIPVDPEFIAVKPVQSIVSTKPHKTFVVLVYAGNGVVRKTVLYTQVPDGVAISEAISRYYS